MLRLGLKSLSVTEQRQGALDLLGFQLDQWGDIKWQESDACRTFSESAASQDIQGSVENSEEMFVQPFSNTVFLTQ